MNKYRRRSTGDMFHYQLVFDMHDAQNQGKTIKPAAYNVSWKYPKCTRVSMLEYVPTPSAETLAVRAKFKESKLKLANALNRQEHIATIVNDCLSRPNPFDRVLDNDIEDIFMSMTESEHELQEDSSKDEISEPNELPNLPRKFPADDAESSSMPTTSDTSSRSEQSLTLSSSETTTGARYKH